MMTLTVNGPLKVPIHSVNGHRMIDEERITHFWRSQASSLSEKRGCYIFMMGAGRGYTPWYVGKSTVRFDTEVFTAHKINKYNKALSHANFGTPVLFFVVMPTQSGCVNRKAINDIECFLIARSKAANNMLLNIQNVPRQTWSISGVTFCGPGAPTTPASKLRKALGL